MKLSLITGVAGFIGSHVAAKLLAAGDAVVGVDSLNDYYDVQLKHDRLERLTHPNFRFGRIDLADRKETRSLFAEQQFDCVFHMAAQAGVRYSLTNPQAYVDSNLVAFVNVLEGCRASPPRHLVYASSSSVYGANRKTPFAVGDPVEQPMNLYAATKRANELMAFSYSHLFRLPTTGLRFFTVYGPWGRPDMAIYHFAKTIVEGRPIEIYNSGRMSRDFTFIDDVVDAVVRIAQHSSLSDATRAVSDGSSDAATPAQIFNIGNRRPVELERLITLLEEGLGRKAIRNYLPMQSGDMLATFADIEPLKRAIGFQPQTTIEVGIAQFVDWFKAYHRID